MPEPLYPSVYQINTRVILEDLRRERGWARRATLDDIPDPVIDKIGQLGFDWVWLLGIWQTGAASRAVSRSKPPLRHELQTVLPDLTDEDISGSPYAVQSYTVHTDFGGRPALERLRARLQKRGLKLLLDFVPNHVALDHEWLESHPEYFVHGSADELKNEPRNYCCVTTKGGQRILAYGRDPYFDGWADVLQLNYRHPGLKAAMRQELLSIAELCDGVRCDMAMLVLPEIFKKTWGNRALPSDGTPACDTPFWPDAIGNIRAKSPGFLMMAEVYWDLEWNLQQVGFDATYDKHLYDCLRAEDASGTRGHLWAELGYMRKSVRFLENHDEPRAAHAFPRPVHEAAAVIAFLIPGIRFIHEGQLEGRKVHVSMHLGRRPAETTDAELHQFYRRLLTCMKLPQVRGGQWQVLNCRAAWDGNSTSERFIAFTWQLADRRRLVVAVNFGSSPSQCYVNLPLGDLTGRVWWFKDLMSSANYERHGDELNSRGLYLDMPPWGYHVFELQPA